MPKPKQAQAWIVTLDKEYRWHCSIGYSWESAQETIDIMMQKYHIKRDMSKATIRQGAMGMPFLDAPLYLDRNSPNEHPIQAWAIMALSRSSALTIARHDYYSHSIERYKALA